MTVGKMNPFCIISTAQSAVKKLVSDIAVRAMREQLLVNKIETFENNN